MVQWAIAGLRSLKPKEAIPLEVAVREGELRAKAGRPKKGEADNYCARNNLKVGTKAHFKARLRRDDPEVAARSL